MNKFRNLAYIILSVIIISLSISYHRENKPEQAIQEYFEGEIREDTEIVFSDYDGDTNYHGELEGLTVGNTRYYAVATPDTVASMHTWGGGSQ